MLIEKRYKKIEGDKEIFGGEYIDEDGNVIMKSRYERKLSWIEKLFNKLKKNQEKTAGDKI